MNALQSIKILFLKIQQKYFEDKYMFKYYHYDGEIICLESVQIIDEKLYFKFITHNEEILTFEKCCFNRLCKLNKIKPLLIKSTF